ncbi:MAG TPA: hypothetical protein DCZ43_03725, partial [candidate division Zixibacteria bacterium]|nr:hypothetical protein [candidate division Zixibacteria bacterium]
MKTKELQRLMHDKYDDHYPTWSKDGRYIAFSSDRPAGSVDSTQSNPYGNYNIYLYDRQTG